MSYTRACWLENKKDFERVIPSSWVDTTRKVVYWPNGLHVKRAFEKLETPKTGWKQFSLIKVKISGTKEDCEGCTDYTTTEEITEPVEIISSDKGKIIPNIPPTFPTCKVIATAPPPHLQSIPVRPPPSRSNHSQPGLHSRSHSGLNLHSRAHSRSRSRLRSKSCSRSRSRYQSKSHSRSRSGSHSKSNSHSRSHLQSKSPLRLKSCSQSRSQSRCSRSRSNSDSRSSNSNSNVSRLGLVAVSPIVCKSIPIKRKDAVHFRRKDFPMDVGDFQYTVIKLLTKQLENQNTIHQQRETTVAGMNLSNLPAKFLQE
ncbi:uncharacterized protein LOC124812150 [Hydra vulgaris]|uniref:uncharacterized protein LOC124812150 n=1 Tax=Hydra vulgaris TaxID=6087 RepID=UPI0001926F7C|nr:uncharacterized protein LOC124812150 isoform X1 [Hydra vulgaris]XP_047134231.1 uncharacterized protein LOC124812150 isoform X1 [Hydra vulgaris]